MDNKATMVRPPLRWAGSKFGLLPKIVSLFPKTVNRYFEPMLGGGSVFFALKPKNALLADENEELINFYKVLRNYNNEFIDHVLKLRPSKDEYYKLREQNPIGSFERAVRFIYLNRLSWNGLYRVNQTGRYNVPFGGRLPKTLWSKEHLLHCSSILKNADLQVQDYTDTLSMCGPLDFVFVDPPYPKGITEGLGFNRYNAVPFRADHHKNLSEILNGLAAKKVQIMLTLGNDGSLLKLYSKPFQIIKIASKSLISCNGDTRGTTVEYILRNYN